MIFIELVLGFGIGLSLGLMSAMFNNSEVKLDRKVALSFGSAGMLAA